MRTERLGDLLNFVVPVLTDSARFNDARRVLSRWIFDERPDVLNPPRSGARTELHRLWKSTPLNTGPPSRLTHRNWTLWGENLFESNKSFFGKSASALCFGVPISTRRHVVHPRTSGSRSKPCRAPPTVTEWSASTTGGSAASATAVPHDSTRQKCSRKNKASR